MPFGYAYVEHSFGHGFLHYAHRAACRHGGCYSHNPVVPACQFEQCLAEYVLVSRSFVAHVFLYELAGFLVELAGSVPCRGFEFGGTESFAFHCVYVQQFRAFHVLYLVQRAHEFGYVVPVHGAEVAYVQSFKDVLLVGEQ